MSATEADVRALEHLAYRIREDAHGMKPWDRQGTHVIFQRELVGMNLSIAVEIVVGHASDPDAKTPAAISRPFTPKTERPKHGGPVKRSDECPEHPGQPRVPFCGGHRTDELAAAYDDEQQPVEIPEGLTGPELVRAAAGMPPKTTKENA